MLKKILLITILSFLFFKFYGQDISKVDSLKSLLNNKNDDTTKVNLLNDISWNYLNNDFDKAFEYATQALDLSKKINFSKGTALSYTHLSYALYRKGKFEDALININKAIAIYEVLNDKSFLSKTYLTLSQIYYATSKFKEAVEFCTKSIEFKKEINDTLTLELNYLTLGAIYKALGDYTSSLESFFISVSYCEKNGNKKSIASNYNNIAIVYRAEGKNELAIEYYKKALEIQKETNNKVGQSQTLNNIAVVFEAINDDKFALEYYNMSLKLCEEINYPTGIAMALTNIAGINLSLNNLSIVPENLTKAEEIFLKTNDKIKLTGLYGLWGQFYLKKKLYSKSIENTQKAYSIANDIGSLDDISKMAKQLAIVYDSINDYKSAYNYFVIYNQINDSIFNIEKSKVIEQMTNNFELKQQKKEIEIKQNEIELYEKDKKLQKLKLISVTGLFFILIIFSFFQFRSLKRKIRIEKQLREKEIEISNSKNQILELSLKNNEITQKLMLDEIEFKNKEIQNFAFHIIDKNNFIQNILSEVIDAKKRIENDELKKELQKIISIINNKQIQEQDREEFLAYVDNINDNFHYKIKQLYPDLTETEQRIISLLKIGFNSKQISSILHITPKSVDTNRYRIRKKLNLETDQNLNDFFKNI